MFTYIDLNITDKLLCYFVKHCIDRIVSQAAIPDCFY